MFLFIHRFLKFAAFSALVLAGWRLYEHRHIFEPALIWYDVWDNGGFDAQPMPQIYGKVEKVLSSQTFHLKTTNTMRLNVRLLGLKDAGRDVSLEVIEQEKERKEALREMLEGQEVRLDLGYQNFNNVGGILYLDKTNINARLVLERRAETEKSLIKVFPRDVQYQFLWSKRRAATNNVADARLH